MLRNLASPLGVLAAVAVFMVAFWITTELLKPLFKASGKKALGLSWLVGLGLYMILVFVFKCPLSWDSGFLFIVITGLCNTAYKWTRIKDVLKTIV